MMSKSPHYLLFAEASRNRRTCQTWRFVLQDLDTQRRFSASDTEEAVCGERLELLAVVRGLEALEGSARVTLVTKSRYVSRGMKLGLDEWRANNWRWERFGKIVNVRDHDLWQRVSRASEFHQVDCQAWHFDDAALDCSASSLDPLPEPIVAEAVIPAGRARISVRDRRPSSLHRGVGHNVSRWRIFPRSLREALGASA
ncbi:MAG: hypothetical protein MK171_05210 [Pirellulales bacterium]|nr:hypothetical protein [Pirellulales bacterium]